MGKKIRRARMKVAGGEAYAGIDFESAWRVNHAWGFFEVQVGRLFLGWTTDSPYPYPRAQTGADRG